MTPRIEAPPTLTKGNLTEALLLGIPGGVIGIAVGIGAALLSGSLSDMRPVIVPTSILLAFFPAAGVGAFLEFYPTSKAAHLDLMEARHYEWKSFSGIP